MKKERIFYIDLIRVICMVLIVIYHFPLSFYMGGRDVLHGTANGSWGDPVVYVFFMISGAALFSTYGRKRDFRIGDYYKKRIMSIYPLFYIAYVLGFMYVFWQRGSTYDIPAWSIIWTVIGFDGYLNSIVPTFTTVGEWFLGALIIIYALFPPLLYLVRKKQASYQEEALAFGKGTADTGRISGMKKAFKVCQDSNTSENAFEAVDTGAKKSSGNLEVIDKKKGLLALLILLLGALYVFMFHPIKAIRTTADPVVDMFFFLLGGLLSDNAGSILGKHRLKFLFGSLAGLMIWVFIALPLPSGELLAGFSSELIKAVAAVLIFIFLMTASKEMGKPAPVRGVVRFLAPYAYGVFLIHHFVMTVICQHFNGDLLSGRDRLVLLLLCLMGVAFSTAVIYRLKDFLEGFIKSCREGG